ncbi:MAG: alpha/beta hydrolase [Planctomycetia bacterium]|nr:alpha/beta hydrolase [Planctomycetia bacterium]
MFARGFSAPRLLLSVMLLGAALASSAAAQEFSGPFFPAADEASAGGSVATAKTDHGAAAVDVWLIDARRAGCTPHGPAPELVFWRYESGNWAPATSAQFIAESKPDQPTCFWVHGNRISTWEANYDGWTMRQRLNEATAGRPVRFVIWSWPSGQIRGQLRDVREKALRADDGAYPLAWVVKQLPRDHEVGLVGFSYGARLISGSLHILGQWSAAEEVRPKVTVTSAQSSSATAAEPPRRRAVLMAAAMDDYAFAEGAHNGLALSQVETMFVFVNNSDRALKWYRRLWGRGGPEALGYVGACGHLGPDGEHLREFDCTCHIGSEHDWQSFVYSPLLMGQTASALFPAK